MSTATQRGLQAATDATAFTFENLHDLAAGRVIADVPCPSCGPQRRSSVNRRRAVLRIWNEVPGFISFMCARCGHHGYALPHNATSFDRERHALARAEAEARHQREIAQRSDIARWLWSRRMPISGTPAETYLREARGYGGVLPATLGYLPPDPPKRAYATMIAAFGMAAEVEPGVLSITDPRVRGVHLTRLKPDGSGKAGTDADKTTVGYCLGAPIVLAPVNDGGGLLITEGIEDALSGFEATGLGAWAAGSASRMAALAVTVPPYVEAVSIVVDDDPAGLCSSNALADALRQRGFVVRFVR